MTTLAEPRPAPAGQRPSYFFGRLLLLLVITYVLSAFTSGALVSAVQVVLFLGVMLLALRTGRLRRRAVRIIAVGLLLGTVAAVTLQLADPHGPGAGVANMWTALVLLTSAFLVVRQVLVRPDITLQSIYGAVSAYLILGLMFAAVYSGIYHFSHETFFVQVKPGHATTNMFQYFSFTTLTTLGYGDYTAAQPPGQAIAMIEAVTGQIFLATLVARLVAGFRRTAGRPGRPPAGAPYPAAGPAPGSADPAAGNAGPAPGDGASRPDTSGPAGERRARSRRASASGLVHLRPPGAMRRRAAPVIPPSSPGRASRARR